MRERSFLGTVMRRRSHRSVSLVLAAMGLMVAAALLGARFGAGETRAVAPAPRPLRLTHFAPERNRVDPHSRNIPQEWDVEKGTNIKWSAAVGSKAYGGPTVAGGKVYIGTNNDKPRDPAIKGDRGVLMCFDEKSGKFLWQLVHNKLPQGRNNDWPEQGIVSSPVVEEDRLYYVSNRCEVVCASVNGKVLWKLDMIEKLGVYPHSLAVCSPLIVDDGLFVVTGNGVDQTHLNIPAPEAPSFLALEKRTGKIRWKSNLPTAELVKAKKAKVPVNIRQLVAAGKLLIHGQWSNPVYGGPEDKPRVIFPGGDGWLYAFKPENGDLIWKFDCNVFFAPNTREVQSDFAATPVVWEDKLYIATGQDPEHKAGVGHLWCIDITRTPTSQDKDVSPGQKESALVWHHGGLVAGGAMQKRPYHFGRSLATCAVHEGLCYAADLDGYAYCFDANSGEKFWEHQTKGNIWGSLYWADGKVYLGNDDGDLCIFKHGKEKKLLNEIEMEGKIRAPLIAAHDVLFLLTESNTKLLAIGKK
jgi:outer membrane protein assembly factor BamB